MSKIPKKNLYRKNNLKRIAKSAAKAAVEKRTPELKKLVRKYTRTPKEDR